MKKLSSILVILFSIFALGLGLYGCTTDETEYWLDGEKSVMNLLEVDILTPVVNKVDVDQYLRWSYIPGATYRVTTGSTPIFTSNSQYTIKVNEYVEVKIPKTYETSVIDVTYTLSDGGESSKVSSVWKMYVWNKIDGVSFYQVVVNSSGTSSKYTSTVHKYNVNNDKDLSYDCFEEKTDKVIYRTTVKNKDNVEKILYVEEPEKDTYNKFFTRLDSQLKQVYDKDQAEDKNVIKVIQDQTAGNIYSVIETKYLYLIRSSFVNVWEFGKLLETVPPTQTSSNQGEIKSAFSKLNNEVLNLQETLNSIKADFDKFKKYFVTIPELTQNYLTNYNTSHGAQLRIFEETITPKIEKIVDFSENFQEFCEKYYNVNKNIEKVVEELRLKSINPIDLKFDEEAFDKSVLKLFTDKEITGHTIKNIIVSYQNKMIKPVYSYYFKEYGGKYSISADERLFNKLVEINNIVLKLTTTMSKDINETNFKPCIETLSKYFVMQEYLTTERAIFLKGLENVDLSEVNEVEWKKDGANYVWDPVETGKKPFVLVELTKGNEKIYVPMHNLITKTINGKTVIAEAQIVTFLSEKYSYADGKYNGYTATYKLYSIENNAIAISYNDRIISYLNETINISTNYITPVKNLINSDNRTTLFYVEVEREIIEKEDVKPA